MGGRAFGDRNGARRFPRLGERNPAARLTAAKVRAIRRAYALTDVTMRELGERYGVSKGAIRFVIRRINWRHVP